MPNGPGWDDGLAGDAETALVLVLVDGEEEGTGAANDGGRTPPTRRSFTVLEALNVVLKHPVRIPDVGAEARHDGICVLANAPPEFVVFRVLNGRIGPDGLDVGDRKGAPDAGAAVVGGVDGGGEVCVGV